MFSCTRSGSRTGLGGDKSKVEEIGASFHMNYGSPRGAPAAFDANGPSPEGSMRWTSTAPTAPAVCFQCGAPYRASGAATTQVGRWHSGLFDMASDLHNCVTTCFCPCVTLGQNVAALDRGKTTSSRQAAAIWCAFAFVGLSCFCSGFWRQSLRSKYNIPYAECGDYCLHLWCGPCALCQVCIPIHLPTNILHPQLQLISQGLILLIFILKLAV